MENKDTRGHRGWPARTVSQVSNSASVLRNTFPRYISISKDAWKFPAVGPITQRFPRQIRLDGFTMVERKGEEEEGPSVYFSFSAATRRGLSLSPETPLQILMRRKYSFHGGIGDGEGESFLGRRKSRLIRLLYLGLYRCSRQPGHYIKRTRALLTVNKRN